MEKIFMILAKRESKFCVLATSSKAGKPEAATVGYAVWKDNTILISTSVKSRKCQNLKENPHVAVVFGTSFEEQNIQTEGNVSIIAEGDLYKEYDSFYFTVHPQAARFKSPDTVFLAITPTWFRLVDYTTTPPQTEEKAL